MLLDLSGLTREERVMSGFTREERVMVQARMLLSFNTHIFTFEKAVNARRGRAKTEIKSNDNLNIRWLQEKDKKKNRNGKLGASACNADYIFAEDYGLNDSRAETADACRARDDLVNPGSEVGEEALDCENTTCSLHFFAGRRFFFRGS